MDVQREFFLWKPSKMTAIQQRNLHKTERGNFSFVEYQLCFIAGNESLLFMAGISFQLSAGFGWTSHGSLCCG
jgi:hypothetical protein